MKRLFALLLFIAMVFTLAACGESAQTGVSAVEKTAVQSQTARYVPIAEVGGYNQEIITDDIINGCTLPVLDKKQLPYWTGYILENKISVNYGHETDWENYTGGNFCWNKEEIRYLAENGFNCVRAVYSLSFLSNPDDPYSINLSELEQLDELIAWCMEYNIHLMLSQSGLPGKWSSQALNGRDDFEYWNTQESVSNDELFRSAEMQALYLAYYDMLAKRYQNIPNSVLSFELYVEGIVPDCDPKLQAEVLGPVAERIWSYTPDRIVIANDCGRAVPKEMAELGCCISLHAHIYTLEGEQVEALGSAEYLPHWPMQYFPGYANENSNDLVFLSENGFQQGDLTLFINWRNDYPTIYMDDTVVLDRNSGTPVYEPEAVSVEIPAGTRKITLQFLTEIEMLGIQIRQGEDTLLLPTHNLHNTNIFYDGTSPTWGNEYMPTLQINEDLSVTDRSEVTHEINSEYLCDTFFQPFLACAEENGVSFIMTEVGTDGASVLTPNEYVAYEECWLEPLKQHGIGWMYNCVHNILAPEEYLWLNQNNTKFTAFSEVETMYGYSVNDTVMDMLKKYQ